jgi:lipoyl-dependent peroxiredoxin
MSLVIEHVTNRVGKLLWTAKMHTSGGRENGAAKSSDGQLDIKLSLPGSKRPGTNPEQLLAAGWSACFEGAIAATVKKMRLTLPADPVIDAEVDLSLGEAEGYFLRARLNISLPGLDRETAEKLVRGAEEICPYSKALGNSIDVSYNLI